jgi:hypothetical protein
MSEIVAENLAQDNIRIAVFPGTFDPFTIGHESGRG